MLQLSKGHGGWKASCGQHQRLLVGGGGEFKVLALAFREVFLDPKLDGVGFILQWRLQER